MRFSLKLPVIVWATTIFIKINNLLDVKIPIIANEHLRRIRLF